MWRDMIPSGSAAALGDPHHPASDTNPPGDKAARPVDRIELLAGDPAETVEALKTSATGLPGTSGPRAPSNASTGVAGKEVNITAHRIDHVLLVPEATGYSGATGRRVNHEPPLTVETVRLA